jgi:Na+-transporting methylmalonyl-CoA/oxaloacetate decarboxylase gamma subunit
VCNLVLLKAIFYSIVVGVAVVCNCLFIFYVICYALSNCKASVVSAAAEQVLSVARRTLVALSVFLNFILRQLCCQEL